MQGLKIVYTIYYYINNSTILKLVSRGRASEIETIWGGMLPTFNIIFLLYNFASSPSSTPFSNQHTHKSHKSLSPNSSNAFIENVKNKSANRSPAEYNEKMQKWENWKIKALQILKTSHFWTRHLQRSHINGYSRCLRTPILS